MQNSKPKTHSDDLATLKPHINSSQLVLEALCVSVKMVGRVVPVLALGFLVLYASFCSCSRFTQVPKVTSWQMPSFQSAGISNPVVQSQITQSGVTQQEGNPLQESLPKTNRSYQSIQKVSEGSPICEVDEPSRVGCGEPGISSADCEALECCYDYRQFIHAYDGPMCYYGNAGEKWKVNCFLVIINFPF